MDLIEGLDYATCGRCGIKTGNAHRIKDDQGSFVGHISCSVGEVQRAYALND